MSNSASYLEFPQGFKILSPNPIDDRWTKLTKEDIIAITQLYEGLLVYCQAEKVFYLYSENNWEQFKLESLSQDEVNTLIESKLKYYSVASNNVQLTKKISHSVHEVKVVDSNSDLSAEMYQDQYRVYKKVASTSSVSNAIHTTSGTKLESENLISKQKVTFNQSSGQVIIQHRNNGIITTELVLSNGKLNFRRGTVSSFHDKGIYITGFGETSETGEGADYSRLRGISLVPLKLVKDLLGELTENIVNELVTNHAEANTKIEAIKSAMGI